MSKFLRAIVNIFMICAILVVAAILVPPLVGINTTIVDSTTMETNLPVGSITYSKDTYMTNLKNGDRILDETSEHTYKYVIVEAGGESGDFKVKDTRSGEESVLQIINSASKIFVTIPFIGYIVYAMHSIEGIIIIALVILVMIILFILSELWKKDSEEEFLEEYLEKAEKEAMEEEALKAEQERSAGYDEEAAAPFVLEHNEEYPPEDGSEDRDFYYEEMPEMSDEEKAELAQYENALESALTETEAAPADIPEVIEEIAGETAEETAPEETAEEVEPEVTAVEAETVKAAEEAEPEAAAEEAESVKAAEEAEPVKAADEPEPEYEDDDEIEVEFYEAGKDDEISSGLEAILEQYEKDEPETEDAAAEEVPVPDESETAAGDDAEEEIILVSDEEEPANTAPVDIDDILEADEDEPVTEEVVSVEEAEGSAEEDIAIKKADYDIEAFLEKVEEEIREEHVPGESFIPVERPAYEEIIAKVAVDGEEPVIKHDNKSGISIVDISDKL